LEQSTDPGILRPRDLRAGKLSVAYLQRLVANGRRVKLGRGQYVLPDREPTRHDMLAVEGSKLAPADTRAAIQVIRLSGRTFYEGIQVHERGRVPVRIYEPAKTVADCFRFRNRVGMDVAIEALRECLRQRQATPAMIWSDAEICRVRTIIKPYLEALA
jgi:hypothetical protein